MDSAYAARVEDAELDRDDRRFVEDVASALDELSDE
jgi:hypothetical protein